MRINHISKLAAQLFFLQKYIIKIKNKDKS